MRHIIVLLVCIFLVAGCSLFTEGGSTDMNNYTIEGDRSQEKSGVNVTLDDVVYTSLGQEGAITLYFSIYNHKGSVATLASSTNPNIKENIILLKGAEQHYTMTGHGGSGFITRRDGNDRTFEFSSGKQSRFHVTFKMGFVNDHELGCHLPIVIDGEQVDFTFNLVQANVEES